MKKKGSVVQLDRISDFGSEGWGFESSLGHFLLFFFLLFNNSSLKADSISNLEIEGMSIGDSALNFFSEKDIIKRIKDCAEKFHLKKFVIVEGDDLFCDHELIIKNYFSVILL